jgi:hypothetical protein
VWQRVGRWLLEAISKYRCLLVYSELFDIAKLGIA